ncbi:LacI family DNA-binding transcriptional regulator [Microbacterium sp. MAH-37]|nr:LacI family DNA-binding transcriptional regulator [Microbacterium sp. MAH-37]
MKSQAGPLSPVEPQRRPSLADIAEQTGVSISTVSKVVNGKSDVSEATRRRVEQAIRNRQYVPPRDRRGDSRLSIAVLARSMTSPYTLEILRGAATAAESADADLVLSMYHDGSDDRSWIESMVRGGRDAVIAVTSMLDGEEIDRLNEVGLPLVIVDPFNDPQPDTVSVGSTNWNGGLAGTEHLLALGHSRIGLLIGVRHALASRAREHGYVAALTAAGITVDPGLILPGEYTFESGVEGALELLALPEPPTAIFAASDHQALGVIEAARRRAVRVPEDLSVVGFDDLPIALSASPPLTTVRQPLSEMGALAMRTAIAMTEGEEPATHHTELATSLVVRASSRSTSG